MLRRASLVALTCLGCWTVPVRAETIQYVLEIPAGQAVRYELELEPHHPGPLSVVAEWEGNRIVSIKLEPPRGSGMTARRNGPSPQRLAADVDSRSLRGQNPWSLSIRSPAGREAGQGLLTIVLPEPEPDRTPATVPDAAPVDPWAAWRMPVDAPRSWTHFDDWAFHFRDALHAERRPDVCRWQEPLLDYIGRTRQALIEDGTVPAPATRAALRLIAGTIDDVDDLRTSDDPFITGPFPDEPDRRRAYLRIRTRELAPLEARLDDVLMRIGRDHAEDLGTERWPVRFVSCMTACERHFAEAPVVGAENAPNAELARAQWDRLKEAAHLLFSLADVEPAP